jgi:hypothetical protein
MRESAFERWQETLDDREGTVLKWGRDAFVSDQLCPAMLAFNGAVWRSGMFDRVDECRVHGMRADFTDEGGDFSLLAFDIAGRVMFTFTDGKTDLTYVADASDRTGDRTGFQSFNGDIFRARQMVEVVINNWPETAESQRELFKANAAVGVA